MTKPVHNSPAAKGKDSSPAGSRHFKFQIAVINAILEASPEGVLVVDVEGRIVSVNHRFFEVWQLSEDAEHHYKVVNRDDAPLLQQVMEKVKDAELFVTRVKQLYANPDQIDHTEIELKNGSTLERHSTALYGDAEEYLGRVWFFRDISEQKREEERLTKHAYTDELTGIPNRRCFQIKSQCELKLAREQGQPLSLILCDVDKFKQINDQYGHDAGDLVLRSLCSYLSSELREIDLLGRLGGDEFVVVLPLTDLAGAAITAEKLRCAIERLQIKFEGAQLNLTITSGIATLCSEDISVETILKRADLALYRAKEKGRNCVEVEF